MTNPPTGELAASQTPALIYCFSITMEASLAACILTALLATGACLQCEVCDGPGISCSGDSDTCQNTEDSCGITLTEDTVVGVKTQNVLKSCLSSSQCKAGAISMNFGTAKARRMSIACCQRDDCTPDPVKLPPADPKPNGRCCRGCYALNADHCNEQTIHCTGAETQCLDVAGPLKSGGSTTKIIMKGCVTESICAQVNAGSGTFLGISGDLPKHRCTPATSAASIALGPAGLLLLALTGLHLLKFFS
ncbi:phospholipase A2 inhibitor gamma subunit B-like [Gopherus flavomarginatus]|uniref:phospholipase A2 inhibitor gamma subunit B-like n=1 Tax=Gopherus flavomarginatus TaxID=286002 RepID=UPI0021CC3110|nr:phospholipase A2 inhibitor gamma subunit B-like [Gopherus flavomarginatus]